MKSSICAHNCGLDKSKFLVYISPLVTLAVNKSNTFSFIDAVPHIMARKPGIINNHSVCISKNLKFVLFTPFYK